MQSTTLEYTNGKQNFKGKLFFDETETGRRPGVVVFPEAFGLGEHVCERAERLARMGYVVLAADFHGGGKEYPDLASVSPVIQALYADRAEWRSRARAAFDALAAQPQVDSAKIAAVGFCFGGTTGLELARSGAPLAGVVTFHAGLIPELPEDAGRIGASVLICHGADDPIVKPEAIDAVEAEFRRDKVDWQFIYYGGALHGFTNAAIGRHGNPALAYNALADRRSWAAMTELFEEVFA